MGERAEFLLQSRDSPTAINSEIWPSPPWSIYSVMISKQKWKLQGREVPPRGSKWEQRLRRTGSKGIGREKKRETVSFPFGYLPVYCLFVVSWVSHSEKAMATHSSTLAWKIPWAEEPGRLQSMGSQRVRHDWATSLLLFTFMHRRRKRQPSPVFLPGESQVQRSLVGCHLWGRTELDTTEATWQQQQQQNVSSGREFRLLVHCLFVVSWVSLWGENSGVISPGTDETFLPSWGPLLSAGVCLARCWASRLGTRGSVFTTKPHRQGQVWQAGDPSPGLSWWDSWPSGTVKWVLQASLWTWSPSFSLCPWLLLFKSKHAVFSRRYTILKCVAHHFLNYSFIEL